MDNKFSLKNFVIREAEEENPFKKNNSTEIQAKDTQYTSQINKEEDNDSYGVPSDNETEKNTSKELATHRLILQKGIENESKEIKKNLKRKRNPKIEKKDNKKRIAENIKNNKDSDKIQPSLGIINGKLNIGFAENKENKDINDDRNRTPEKKVEEEDEEIDKLKLSNERKKIENVNKKINKDFIKRMKENENFIKNNNIIMADGSDAKIGNNMKRNKSDIDINKKSEFGHKKLKLYNFKGAFLNKNKK